FCLGLALLVLPPLVVFHSSGSAHQRLPLFVALAFLRKWLATWKMGFSGTSKSTIARPHYSEHSRIVLFCERMLFLVSRISARANFGASQLRREHRAHKIVRTNESFGCVDHSST